MNAVFHASQPHDAATDDAMPDPEPAAPSLPAPDPAVFHTDAAEASRKVEE